MVFTRNTVPVSDKVWRRFHFPLTMCHAFPSQQCFRHPAREFDTLKSKKVPQSLEIGLFFCQIFIFII